jgi:hypothetical protein
MACKSHRMKDNHGFGHQKPFNPMKHAIKEKFRMKEISALLAVLALLLQTAVVKAQNIVINGGFETGTFSGWTTNIADTSGSIAGAAAYAGSYGAEFSETIFEGDEGSIDEMSQTLATQAGSNYVFSFWANGFRQSSLGANWNGTSLLTNSIYYTGFSPISSGWTNFQFLVQATSASTTLTFAFKSDPSGEGGSTSLTYLDDVAVLPSDGFNQISAQTLSSPNVKLTFIGIPGANYALDRTFNLDPPIQWTPLSTNAMGLTGTLALTTAAVTTTNNFWRFRTVP